MAPILESLRREYEGKANVIFVHVGEQQVLASRYGIRAIPVQVFFDRSGQEVSRHVGFFAEDDIKAKLREAGVK
jgi:thioredoxin 1